MWRTVFLLLVLANLIFFAWGQGYLGGLDEGREPARLSGQFQPERLRVTSRTADMPAPVEAEPSRPAPEDAGPSAEVVTPGFLVHIPPLPGKAAADRKAAEIRQLGIRDFRVVTEAEPAQFSILLGEFESEQAANEFLAGLVGKGVRSARVQAIGAVAQ